MLARVIIAYTRLYREIYAMHIYVHYLFWSLPNEQGLGTGLIIARIGYDMTFIGHGLIRVPDILENVKYQRRKLSISYLKR